LAGAQETAISSSTTVASRYKTSELPDPRNIFKGSATDKSTLWRVNLALQLVQSPDLNKQQKRVILDAISLSSSEFFAASGDKSKKIRADSALQTLRRQALNAFSNSQAFELFANIAGKTEADILKMYYDVSALSLKKRKASFRNASSNDKSDLWRTHLALFLVKRPELNEWQKEIILAAISLVTPEYFEVRPSNPAWRIKVREPLRFLEAQIVNAFSLEDGAKIFATLGDDTELAKSSASVLLRSINYKQLSDSGSYNPWTHSTFGGQDMELERSACQCSTESDWCPIYGYCNGTNCNPTQSGCGTLWSYPCNGASC
jgi:hypothetical protein